MKLQSNSSLSKQIMFFFAEFSGTAMLLFIGCMGTTQYRLFPLFESALSFGLGFMVAVQSFRHVSGAHINPILTIGAIIVGYLSVIDAIFYLMGQFLGAIAGYGLLRLVIINQFIYGKNVAGESHVGTCSGFFHPQITEVQGLFLEFLISFTLSFVVCGVWEYRNRHKIDSIPLRLGFSVIALTAAAGPYTGAHMNPARTLAPAIVNNYWDKEHIYCGGQLLGATTAAIIFAIFFSTPQESEKSPEESRHENWEDERV